MKAAIMGGVVLAAMLAGCGTAHEATDAGQPTTGPTPRPTGVACASPLTFLGSFDVNADGRPDPIDYSPGSGGSCPAQLYIAVGARRAAVPFSAELPVARSDLRAVRVPGRSAALLLLVQHSPRGGFALSLSAWAGTTMQPVDLGLGFVATDAATRYVTAACTAGGFTLTEARLAAAPSWDVYRTTYGVNGDSFSVSPRAKVASSLTDRQLRTAYPDLVNDRLFGNCAPATG